MGEDYRTPVHHGGTEDTEEELETQRGRRRNRGRRGDSAGGLRGSQMLRAPNPRAKDDALEKKRRPRTAALGKRWVLLAGAAHIAPAILPAVPHDERALIGAILFEDDGADLLIRLVFLLLGERYGRDVDGVER